MDSTHPTQSDSGGTYRCRECQAENPPDALYCRLCNRHDWREDESAIEQPAALTLDDVKGWIFLIGLIVIALVVLPVLRPLALYILCVVSPAMLIGEVQALRCRRSAVPLSGFEQLRIVVKYAIVLTAVGAVATPLILIGYWLLRVLGIAPA
jgi:hypothetical protein